MSVEKALAHGKNAASGHRRTFGTQHQLRSDSYSGNFSCHVQSPRNLYLLSSCATHGTALHSFHVRSSFLQMRTTAFLYGIRCPDSSQKRIFPTDFPAPHFTDFNRNGDPKHPDRGTDPGAVVFGSSSILCASSRPQI